MVASSQGSEGSQRQYAKHRGCTHGAVQKAIKTGRLSRAVSVVNGVTRIDFDAADDEWERNTDPSRTLHRAGPDDAGASTPSIVAMRPEQLAVTVDADLNLVLLAWEKYPDVPEMADAWFLLPMARRTALQLVERLLAAAALVTES